MNPSLLSLYPTGTFNSGLTGYSSGIAGLNSFGGIGSSSLFNTISPFSGYSGLNSFNSFPQSSNNIGNILMLLLALLGQGQSGIDSDDIPFSDEIIDSGDSDDVQIDDEIITIDDADQGIWGDPHYTATGADGKTAINFIHKGEVGKTYNVFSGNGLEVDSYYGAWGPAGALQTETQIHAGKDLIDYKQNGSLTINGETIKSGQTATLKDGTKVTVNGSTVTVTKDGGTLTLTNTDGIIVDPSGKFKGLDGILGTAIEENRNLTEAQANEFDISDTNKAIKGPNAI